MQHEISCVPSADVNPSISGIALLRELSSTPFTEWKKIIATSRRPPLLDHEDDRITFESIDLLGDPKDLAGKLKEAQRTEVPSVG